MKRSLLILFLTLACSATLVAQSGSFSFQGRLNDGTNPANGAYDLEFRLFDAATGGNPIGPVVERPNTALINGVFSVMLSFGATAFDAPDSVYIQISVKKTGSPNAFTVLGPRQNLTIVPISVRSISSATADTAFTAVNAGNAQALNGFSSNDFIRNSVAPIAGQNFNIIGNGVINGNLMVAGATTQPRTGFGLPKAMAYIGYQGNVKRCFNGVSGATTGNCGITVQYSGQTAPGEYALDFPFQVNDRFVVVTAESGSSVTLNASYAFSVVRNDRVSVEINITDVDHNDSFTAGDFMIIVH